MGWFGRNKNNQENTDRPEGEPSEFPTGNYDTAEFETPQQGFEGDLEFATEKVDADQVAETTAERVLSEDEVLLQLINEEFAKDFEHIRELEGDKAEIVIEQARKDLLEKLHGPEAKNKLTAFFKKHFAKFSLGALGGFAARGLVKSTARAYLGTISFGGSVALGALVGGGFAAIQSYRKDYEKVISSDVIRQLEDSINEIDNVKLANVIDLGRESLKKGKLLAVEANALKVKLQKAELQLRLSLNPEKVEGLDASRKFLQVLNESRQSRKDLTKLEGIKHQKLEKAIEFETKKNPNFMKQFGTNVAVGAVSGGLGGAAGYGVHMLIDSEFAAGAFHKVAGAFGIGHGAEKVIEHTTTPTATPTAEYSPSTTPAIEYTPTPSATEQVVANIQEQLECPPDVAEQVADNLGSFQQEMLNAHSADLLDKAQAELLEQKFTILAAKGEGATNAARDLIHDFLVNKEHLQGLPHSELTPEQIAKLVYTEDSLMKDHFLEQTVGAGHIVQPDQAFELTGAQIEQAWDKAQDLSPEQLASLTKLLGTPGHHLSEEALKAMGADSYNNLDNNFFDQIAEHLKDTATDAVQDQSLDGLAVQAQVESVIGMGDLQEGLNAWQIAKAVTAVIAGLAAAGVAVGAGWLIARKFKGKESGQNKQESDQIDPNAPHRPNPFLDPIEESNDHEIVDASAVAVGGVAGAEQGKNAEAMELRPGEITFEEFEGFHAQMKGQFKVEIYKDRSDKDAEFLKFSRTYLEELPKIFAKYPAYFDGKKIILTVEGNNSFNAAGAQEFYVNVISSRAGKNLDWLTDFAESDQEYLEFSNQMMKEFGKHIISEPEYAIKAKKFYPEIRQAIASNPANFENKHIKITTDPTAEDINRVYLNVNSSVREIKSFLEMIANRKPITTASPVATPEAAPEEYDDEVTTIVLPRRDPSTTIEITERKEAKIKEFFYRNNVEIHASDFEGRNLSVADLERAGLEPVYDVKIGDAEIKLSQPYRLGNTRIAVTAYVKDNGGFVARSYYRSNSAGVWRYLPGYLSNGEGGLNWFDKAMNEEAITLPSEVQQALAHISNDTGKIKQAEDSNFLFAGTARSLVRIAEGGKDRTIVSEVNSGPQVIAGLEEEDGPHKRNPETVDVTDPTMQPNFDKLVANWEQTSDVYTLPDGKQGTIEVEVFESINGDLRYMFCTDKLGRAWLAGMETVGPVKSTGLRQAWIKGGDMVTPAYEYPQQSDGFGNRKLRQGNYVDMYENYVSKLRVIQEYQKYRAKKFAIKEPQQVEPLDSVWSDALGKSNTKEAEAAPSAEIEQPTPDKGALDDEAKSKGLTEGQTRVWYELMMDKGGLVGGVDILKEPLVPASKGKASSKTRAQSIKEILSSIPKFIDSGNGQAVEKSKAVKLAGIYEILFPIRLKLEKDSEEWDQIDKLIKKMRKLTPTKATYDIITEAEKIGASRSKTTLKKLGLK